MKAKSLLLFSLVSIPMITTCANDNMDLLTKHLRNPVIAATIGCGIASALKHFGAERITDFPVASHLFMVATDAERTFMLSHLELLGAIIGALIATGNIEEIFKMTKAAAVCDLMQRIINREISIQSLAYATRDLLWMFDAPQYVLKKRNPQYMSQN